MFVVSVKRVGGQKKETEQKVICHKWTILWTNQQGVQVSTPVSVTNVSAFGVKFALINPPLQICVTRHQSGF